METKKCTKCQIEKSLDQFYIRKTQCKECTKEYRKQNPEYMIKYRAQNREYFKEWNKENEEKIKDYNKKYYMKNKEKMPCIKKEYTESDKTKAKEYYERNKEKIKLRAGLRYADPKIKEHLKERSKKYYYKNKSLCIDRMVAYQNDRCEKDYLFSTKQKLRHAVYQSFRRIGKSKPINTLKLLGCTWEEAKLHFEKLFQPGMSWLNQGKWHIDHIRPVVDWKDDELHLMNHISNLQPLWSEDNLAKSDKLSSQF